MAIDPAFGVGGKKTPTVPKLTGGITASKDAQSLYVDPTPAYQPVLDYLKKQETAANQRYATNKADITNLFGALSNVAAEDAARIKEQFTQSIASQQSALAARTAEARQGAAAGIAQAEATGAERGAGPGMAVNPISVATQEGVDRSNAYQTTWQALQEANKQQAVTDVGTRQAGYGQQQVGALKQLSQNLEDRLMEIGGNTAQVQSDIAKAKIGGIQNVAQANYSETQAAKAAQQRAAAAAAAASAKAKADANKPKTYPKTLTGLVSYINDIAPTQADANSFMDSLSKVESDAVAGNKTSGQAYTMWLKTNSGADQAYKTKAKEYFTYYYKK